MLLIDTLIDRKGDDATATASLAPGNICLSETHGVLPEYFIELMAQTMAAANGYDAVHSGEPPKDGFIVGLDRCTVASKLTAGKFTIKIVKTMQFGSMKVLEGQVLDGDRMVAAGEIKVWEQGRDED